MVKLPDDRPYWRPRDLATLLQTSPSHVYRLIERGEIEHRRIGARAIRIPASAVTALLTIEGTSTSELEEGGELARRAKRFEARTELTPEQFVQAWRRGAIKDTPDDARDAMEALALREELRGRVVVAP